MTFNPSRYEHAYGNHLLDDIHNLFPEFLYDPGMFQRSQGGHGLLTFFQNRTQELFPEEFAHNRAQYRLYQMERRRRDSGFFPLLPQTPPRRHSQTQIPPPLPLRARNLQQPRHPLHPQPAHATQPAQAAHAAQAAPAAQATRDLDIFTVPLATIMTMTGDDVRTTTTNTLNSLLAAAMLGTRDELADLLTPVPVIPTQDQIDTASIVSSLEPPTDVTCAICQDHEPRATEWRILRHCGHRFHRACIDEWFRQNVHCPVCRHDIRESNETSA